MNNTIRISCNLNNLKVVRDFVTEYLNLYGLSDIVQNQIILAVDEIAANVIIHSNQLDERQFMKLTIFRKDDTFLFEFCDKGKGKSFSKGKGFGQPASPEKRKPFNPDDYSNPNIIDKIRIGAKGGMGIAMVKKIMDKVEYDSNATQNTWRLYKKIS